MANKEGLVSGLPTNLATKVETGLILGRVIKEARINERVRGVELIVGEIEDLVHLSIVGNGDMHDVYKNTECTNEELREIEKRYGESELIVSFSGPNQGGELMDARSPYHGGIYGTGNRVYAVWKSRK